MCVIMIIYIWGWWCLGCNLIILYVELTTIFLVRTCSTQHTKSNCTSNRTTGLSAGAKVGDTVVWNAVFLKESSNKNRININKVA